MRRAKGRDDMSPEEAMEADVIDLRCLALCIAMLERVHGVSGFYAFATCSVTYSTVGL